MSKKDRVSVSACRQSDLCFRSVRVMPSEDTLKWTSVARGGVDVENVAVIARLKASGPVRLSMSTPVSYTHLTLPTNREV